MLRAEFSTRPTLAATPTAPISGTSTGAFSGVFRETQQEITSLISHGFPADAAQLSPAAAALRQQLQMAMPAGDFSHLNDEQQGFLAEILPYAKQAGAALGVSPDIIAAHAALESGWGQRPLRREDGSNSHNLFGLKATQSWQGASLTALTTEFQGGRAQKQIEPFRAYGGYAEAFTDYVALLQRSPRFSAVQGVGADSAAFANVLARGGYATDPAYAGKLQQLVARIRTAD